MGKPYWYLQFTVQDGKYAGNSVFSNIMLFNTEKDGTLSSLAQFLKALGYDITEGEFELPDEDEIQGKSLLIIGRKILAGYDTKAKKELPDRFRITGYKKLESNGKVTSSSNSSILP